MTFTKLFSSITESTIWCEDHPTVRLWICMLAMADKKGRVFGTIPGLASRARISVSECRIAIDKFLAPDSDSRSNTYAPETEGRRIEVIEGGWVLINHAYYRAIRDEEERRIYKTEHERQRRAKRGQNGQKWTAVDSRGHNAEAEARTPLPPLAETVQKPFNETEVAVALCRERGVIGVEEITLVAEAVRANGGDHIETATKILDGWQKHRDSGKFPQQLKAFIKQGHWKEKPKPKRKYLTDDPPMELNPRE